MSELQAKMDAYDATIKRAGNLVDLSQKAGAPFTETQQNFAAALFELSRLALQSAPDFVLLAALEEVHTQAQAVIAELAE